MFTWALTQGAEAMEGHGPHGRVFNPFRPGYQALIPNAVLAVDRAVGHHGGAAEVVVTCSK